MVLFVTAETETDSSDTPKRERELAIFVASGTRRLAVVMPSEKSVQLSVTLPRMSVVRVRAGVAGVRPVSWSDCEVKSGAIAASEQDVTLVCVCQTAPSART